MGALQEMGGSPTDGGAIGPSLEAPDLGAAEPPVTFAWGAHLKVWGHFGGSWAVSERSLRNTGVSLGPPGVFREVLESCAGMLRGLQGSWKSLEASLHSILGVLGGLRHAQGH